MGWRLRTPPTASATTTGNWCARSSSDGGIVHAAGAPEVMAIDRFHLLGGVCGSPQDTVSSRAAGFGYRIVDRLPGGGRRLWFSRCAA